MGILEAGAFREVHEGWVEFVQAEMLGERCFLVEKPETRGVDMGRLYRGKSASPSGSSTGKSGLGHEKPRSPHKDCAQEPCAEGL